MLHHKVNKCSLNSLLNQFSSKIATHKRKKKEAVRKLLLFYYSNLILKEITNLNLCLYSKKQKQRNSLSLSVSIFRPTLTLYFYTYRWQQLGPGGLKKNLFSSASISLVFSLSHFPDNLSFYPTPCFNPISSPPPRSPQFPHLLSHCLPLSSLQWFCVVSYPLSFSALYFNFSLPFSSILSSSLRSPLYLTHFCPSDGWYGSVCSL